MTKTLPCVLAMGLGAALCTACIFVPGSGPDSGASQDAGTDTGRDAGVGSGAALFRMTRSHACTTILALGCAIDRPLMVGVHETIRVDLRAGSSVPRGSLRFRASVPSVLDVGDVNAPGPSDDPLVYSIAVTALAAGDTLFEALRADGSVLDRVAITVAEPTTLDVHDEASFPGLSADHNSVTVSVGRVVWLIGTPLDAAGTRFFANDGVRWTTADPTIATVTYLLQGPREVTDDFVYLHGRQVGTTQVTLTTHALSRTLTVNVVP